MVQVHTHSAQELTTSNWMTLGEMVQTEVTTVTVQERSGKDAASQSTYTHSQSGSEWMSYGFAVDFSTAPGFVGEFGEITFGASETAN